MAEQRLHDQLVDVGGGGPTKDYGGDLRADRKDSFTGIVFGEILRKADDGGAA